MFKTGERVQGVSRLILPVDRPGRGSDFFLAGIATPVVHARVATVLTALAPGDVQLLPVNVADSVDNFFILVAVRVVRCVDDEASDEVEYWLPQDGEPEKVGTYRKVSGMRIDPSKVGDAKVFRTWGWSIALIVSEEIKDALERIGATGVSFTEV
ncbi:imm11 family protein [Pyxidicoccus xibeiensis]|uniref:imm11 family protein n=1 Tax=Pyxidicoccus xibeiensis TaxID=2906759 RepID=UPI0020A75CB8|nr:DUF1629 domain-containing protein [Pyxidicoccus xibeiensis]MCP3136719.1 hypothetical protein [Pyxidicoccus xibeiensis]